MSSEDALLELVRMGFSRDIAVQALHICGGDKEQAAIYLLDSYSPAVSVKGSDSTQEKTSLDSQESLYNLKSLNNPGIFCKLPSNEDLVREEGCPVGLLKGETGPFNCLLQTYFMIPNLVETIFRLGQSQDLKKLFGLMVKSQRRSVDPYLVGKQYYQKNTLVGQTNREFFRILDSLEKTDLSGIFRSKIVKNFVEKKRGFVGNGQRRRYYFFQLEELGRSLYQAWEKNFKQKSEKIIEEQVKFGHTEIWIEKLPKIIIFQYHIRKFHGFRIEKILYPDRFLLQNKELSLSLQARFKQLTSQTKILQTQIDKFNKYRGEPFKLQKLLQLTQVFLSKQTSQRQTVSDCLTLYDPQMIIQNFNQIHQLQDLLKKYEQSARLKLNRMLQQMSNIQKQIQTLYDRADLKQRPYQLHSIFLYKKNSYYTYIYDFQYELWRKYKDQKVTLKSEQKVFQDSFGNSFGLCYIENSLTVHTQLLRCFSIELISQDLYTSMIPSDIWKEVVQDNNKLQQQINEYKLQSETQAIMKKYIRRYTQVVSQATHKQRMADHNLQQELNFQLINLDVHIKLSSEDEVMRWHLLDTIIVQKGYKGLQSLPNDLYSRLKEGFCGVFDEAPASIELSETQQETLKAHHDQFYRKFYDCSILIFILNSIDSNELANALQGVWFLLQDGSPDSEFRQQARKLNKVVIFRITSDIWGKLSSARVQAALVWMGYIIRMTLSFISRQDEHFSIIYQRFLQFKEIIGENQEFDLLFSSLQTGQSNLAPPNQYPRKLEKILRELKKINGYEWFRGWSSKKPATQVVQMYQKVYNSQLRYWRRLSDKLDRGQKVNLRDFASAESRIGIK